MSAARAKVAAAEGDCARWFLVQSQAGRESLADMHLKRQDYTTFLPTTWRSIRHARKIRTERTAYFPGYLFVALDLERDRWRPIDGTTGVVQIIKADGRPRAAPRGLVETLQSMVDTDGALRRLGSTALAAGDQVQLIRGPFAEQFAQVDALAGPARVRVLLSMMGQKVPIEVSRQDLALA